jgi:hypothetical protein
MMAAIKIAVMRAVQRGAHDALSVAEMTGLPPEAVMGAAACLRGDEERPDLLCCLDGEPWALTLEGRMLMDVLI